MAALGEEEILRALKDGDAGIREHAIRLAEPRLTPVLTDAVLALASDGDPRVRVQLVLTLGEARFKQVFETLVRLTPEGAGDAWMRAALLTSAGHEPVEWLAALKREAPEFLEKPGPGALELVRALAQAVGTERSEARAAAWMREIAGGDRPRPWQREALSCLPALRRAGLKIEPPAAWAAGAATVSTDASRPVAERVEAIGLLALLGPSDVTALVHAREPQEVQIAAVRATATPRILENWASLTGPVRREIVSVLIGRADGVKAVLDRMEQGMLRPVDLEAHHRGELLRHPDAAVRNRAKALLAPRGSEEREEVIRGISAKLSTLQGDRARGEKVYRTSCATCHRLAGQGTKVGPDLEGILGRDRAALLVDLLDPNRAMDPSYQVYVVRTTSNETVNGILASETPAGVTLRRAGGEESTIARRDIAELKAWPASLMPEGIENNVTAQDFADLLEFLSRPPQK
jgi:putative heme-binding domain-containing protein